MRNSEFYKAKGLYYPPSGNYNEYFLFNNIGAQIYIMSKGEICNRGMMGLSKYSIKGRSKK